MLFIYVRLSVTLFLTEVWRSHAAGMQEAVCWPAVDVLPGATETAGKSLQHHWVSVLRITVLLNPLFWSSHSGAMARMLDSQCREHNSNAVLLAGLCQLKMYWNWSIQYQLNSGIGAGIGIETFGTKFRNWNWNMLNWIGIEWKGIEHQIFYAAHIFQPMVVLLCTVCRQ